MPAERTFYEDIEVGSVLEYGDLLVTREDVLDFAAKFDPQDFHLSDEAAAASPFGRIAASGWHTASMTMRMLVDHVFGDQQVMGGAGVDKLRWRRPVYPGDRLHCRAKVLSKRRSSTNREMGLVTSGIEGFNQDNEIVIAYQATSMIRVRDPAAPLD